MLALTAFQDVFTEFGLTVSIPKTKFMVAGVGATPVDIAGFPLHGQEVENGSSFVYLGSVITPDARSAGDVLRRLSLALRAFGSLQDVFANRDLSLHVKRQLYNACVMTVLLYASECWCPLQGDLRHLDSFHHQCIRSILCVSQTQQWEEPITNEQLQEMWVDPSLLSSRLRKRRLEWLGHVARMPDVRVHKQLLFGFLPSPWPARGPCRRWRDVISADLRHIGIEHLAWYGIAQDRSAWRASAVLPKTNLNGWTVLSATVRFAGQVTKQGTSVAQSGVSPSRISVVLCNVVHAGGGFTLVVACVCIIVCPLNHRKRPHRHHLVRSTSQLLSCV